MRVTDRGKHFVRYEMGELRVIALRDGHVDRPVSRLREPGGNPFGGSLPQGASMAHGLLRLSVNAFAVVEREGVTLVDTGAGTAWEPTMGLVAAGLKDAGIGPGVIRTVALTHTHLDHVGGLYAPGSADLFRGLQRILVPEAEFAGFRQQQPLGPLLERCVPIPSGFNVSPAITALGAPGHEVGHTCFAVRGGEESMLVWGDIVHVPSMQFSRPELAWEFDRSQNGARASRARMFAIAAGSGWFVAGAHLDSPGVGSLKACGPGKAMEFTPL